MFFSIKIEIMDYGRSCIHILQKICAVNFFSFSPESVVSHCWHHCSCTIVGEPLFSCYIGVACVSVLVTISHDAQTCLHA